MPHALDYGVVDVLDVLDHVLSLGGEVNGDEYRILCPNPQHLERNPSCDVNLATGYWSCLSCGKGGDLVELVRVSKGMTMFEARALLKPSTNEGLLEAVKRRLELVGERVVPKASEVRKPKLPGPYESGPMTYMLDRGFTKATCKKWGLRYVEKQTLDGKKGPFTIRHSIAIPIRDPRGHLLAWCYRATDASPLWQPKYVYTPGAELSELWFGPQHYAHERRIVVVEGALDAMWSDQCGYPAWALLGSKMGVQKIFRLTDHRQAVLLGDNDDAGAAWVERVSDQVGQRMPLFVAQYRDWMLSKRPDAEGVYRPAKDPEEFRPLDLELTVELALPYLHWREECARVQA